MGVGNILLLLGVSGILALPVVFIVRVCLQRGRTPSLLMTLVLFLSLQAVVSVVLYFLILQAASDAGNQVEEFLLSLPPFRWLI